MCKNQGRKDLIVFIYQCFDMSVGIKIVNIMNIFNYNTYNNYVLYLVTKQVFADTDWKISFKSPFLFSNRVEDKRCLKPGLTLWLR